MARLYADENFPLPVVAFLRSFGHDVLTAKEAGKANQRIPDEDVLAFAVRTERGILTRNRRHFIRLHQLNPDHTGIVVCTEDPDFEKAAIEINKAILVQKTIKGKLIRVLRSNS
ncbi:DUF5615 family PIN-like protein [Aphanothece sacrum]|uniref:DUF5615 family PIN-like protein n=1 Tax=Aphanothece sacrum TaxID=1122 RepID=UPI000F60ABE7|nr:DUF5615 family PIN-like protein [Aphanothece sacrum]